MTPRHTPDGMKCIICYKPAQNGVINHTVRCPSYVRPKTTATTVRLSDIFGARRR